MRIVVLNSGRKKGNTRTIIDNIKDNLKLRKAEWVYYNLNDYDINYCKGCELCLRKGSCVIEDDVQILMEALKKADGVIMASPVYMGNISGKLKTFIDRTCRWYHRPELIGVPLLSVVSTAGSDLKHTLNYLEKTGIYWGMQPAGKIGKKFKEYDLIEQVEYKNFIWHLKNEQVHYSPSLKQLIYYQVQKILAENILDKDRKFWEQKGWLNELFYYDCRINIFKKSIATLFYKFLKKKIADKKIT